MKGVSLVLRLFQQKLERYEVKPFEVTGQPFDPRVHEAVSRVESAEVPAGAVAAELQKGYRVGSASCARRWSRSRPGRSPTKPSEG